MILDTFDQLSRYYLPHKEDIIRFMNGRNPFDVAEGEHAIVGRSVFVRVMGHEPKPACDNKFETHREYADVQLMVKGIELMQVAFADQLKPLTAYDAEKDVQFFGPTGALITDLAVGPGQFAIFYPGEAHRPACLFQGHPGPVRKFVFKVKMD